MLTERNTQEWLQTNQYGSFAIGCIDRVPRRKYHSLLTVREPGFGDPLNVLVETNESVSIGNKTYLLYNFDFGSQIYPQGFQHLVEFTQNPTPTWTYKLDSLKITRSFEIDSKRDIVRVHYRFEGLKEPTAFILEPMIACRPFHQLTRENPFLNGAVRDESEGVSIEPYHPLPRFFMKVTGRPAPFISAGRWDKGLFYAFERERGYEATEDLFCPGRFQIALMEDCELTFHFGTNDVAQSEYTPKETHDLTFAQKLKQACDQFLITKKNGLHSAVAGYPWFDEWTRDTLIAIPGLCLANGDTVKAKQVLEGCAKQFLKKVIPNAPALSGQPQNLMVDAPLLFIYGVQCLHQAAGPASVKTLMPAVYHILGSLKEGADSRIRVTSDCGIFIEPGAYATTWMDAVVNGQPITPRNGFVIELNALLYNAVRFATEWAKENKHTGFIQEWKGLLEKADAIFLKRFWSEKHGYLADFHNGTTADFVFRPNQLWATALPYSPIPAAMAKTILKNIKEQLVTPLGLRTLAQSDPRFHPTYRGSQRDRDQAYHQGTVWPWLLGIYADSIVKAHGKKQLKTELEPILKRIELHMNEEGCLGQISELFDGVEPHLPGGAPAQAWSVAEVNRIMTMIQNSDEE